MTCGKMLLKCCGASQAYCFCRPELPLIVHVLNFVLYFLHLFLETRIQDYYHADATGLIFYPGGKVQYEAYAPLLYHLAENGIFCVLLHMPGNLAVLSVYGTEDGVLKQDSYQKDFANLPADTTEVILNGGCHSYFGDYGMQKGDGSPTISREEQIAQTTDAILDVVQKHE